MTEETKHDMEEEDFEILLLESDVRGYLYESQYSLEQLRLMEDQETPRRRPVAVEDPALTLALGGLLLPVLSLRATAYGHSPSAAENFNDGNFSWRKSLNQTSTRTFVSQQERLTYIIHQSILTHCSTGSFLTPRFSPLRGAGYFVDCDEQSSSLEFVVPRDLADGFINNKRENYNFRFQKVFDQTANQEEIFETIAKPVADNVLAGYNGTIFAYGQTGSGKTFTITGGAEHYNDRGIIPRTLSYLYHHICKDSSMVYTTHISYLEIYNEAGYDLLNPQHEASRLEDLP
ncbi:kinesin-like protein KIF9 [Pimephales promelas]|nr:kinesin-like protein KIF9 [Pimephales promelas]